MEYRKLGKTGLTVSRVGFGGIPIQRVDGEGTKKVVEALLRAGVNYIDSARGYTVSESYLGYGLEGVRDRFVLATKSMARTKAAMAADIDTSLRNFRTDYIDLYQIHNPTETDLEQVMAPGGALEALREAKDSGKIGHIGITLHSADLFRRALEFPWVETIMFPYNIVETQGADLIRACGERGIGFICMKPLAGGAIEDGALAMRYIAQNPDVSVVIPGMEKPKQVEENCRAFSDPTPLTPEEQQKIQTVRDSLGTNFCRRCNYCAPCTAGISIPGVFLMEGYLSRYGLEQWAKTRYDAMEKTASDCVECGVCETRCPYHLPIREMMKQAAQKFGK